MRTECMLAGLLALLTSLAPRFAAAQNEPPGVATHEQVLAPIGIGAENAPHARNVDRHHTLHLVSALTLGVTYAASGVAAAAGLFMHACATDVCTLHTENFWLLVPFAGPFILVTDPRPEPLGVALSITDGVVQLGAFVALMYTWLDRSPTHASASRNHTFVSVAPGPLPGLAVRFDAL